MHLTKAEVARHQLGTALELFLRDQDPVSVHVLACSGGEIADQLSVVSSQHRFSLHMLKTYPDKTAFDLRRLRNQYWNAFKHATNREGQAREDQQLLSDFSDVVNDHMLFIGWYDYMMAEGKLPVPAQVFQVWYFAMYPTKINSEQAIANALTLFGDISNVKRSEAKRRLRVVADDYMNDAEIVSNPSTDPRSLILSNLAR